MQFKKYIKLNSTIELKCSNFANDSQGLTLIKNVYIYLVLIILGWIALFM